MAVNQLNYYTNIDTSIIDLQNTMDAAFISTQKVSLTNWDNTSESQIAVGSILENNGILFQVTANTAISGSPSDGHVYITLVPSGDPALGTATVTPTYTNTAPTWSDAKQGWYGTGGSATYGYLPFKFYKSTTNWYNKALPCGCIETNIPIYMKEISFPSGTTSVTINHYIYNAVTDTRIVGMYFYENNGSNYQYLGGTINYIETSDSTITYYKGTSISFYSGKIVVVYK